MSIGFPYPFCIHCDKLDFYHEEYFETLHPYCKVISDCPHVRDSKRYEVENREEGQDICEPYHHDENA